MQPITSTANPTVRRVHRLQREAKARREAGRFCVETPRDLARALEAGFTCDQVYALEARWHDEPTLRRLTDPAVKRFIVADGVLAKMTYRQNPAGFVAVMVARQTALADLPTKANGCYLVCAGLEKPGNLGAILRSADAAGVDAVLIDQPTADLFNPNCIRASTGAVFSVPVVCDEVPALVSWLRERSIAMIAATPESDQPIDALDLTGPTAWLLGSEAQGLDERWREAADQTAAIPMLGRTVDSLNVSVTAALLLYETNRQRRSG